MSGELILFFILALTAILTAAGMLLSRHAVYAALYLVLNFGTVAIFYLLLGAEQITAEFSWNSVVPAGLLGLALVIESLVLVLQKVSETTLQVSTSVADAAPAPLATKLFTVYLLPFEITSILLLVAMVGAIILTKTESRSISLENRTGTNSKKG